MTPIANAKTNPAFSETGLSPQWVSALHSDILFMSATSAIRASGTFRRIEGPVSGPTVKTVNDRSAFLDRVAEAMIQAKGAGMRHPIVMGALPFDLTHEASLLIPQCHAVADRQAMTSDDLHTRHNTRPRLLTTLSEPPRTAYETAVAKAAALIRAGQLNKTVLSRRVTFGFDADIDVDATLRRLVALNPSVTHFRFPLSDGSILLGASPELLLRRQGRKVTCNPLAGSARRASDPEEDARIGEALLASAKDRHEHEVVVAQLRETLAPLCDHLDVPPVPSLIKTAQMWHLSTHIEGTLSDPQLTALDLAIRIHPTPAVCGDPTEAARKLIAELEPFERGFFAGAVGWCDSEGNGEWSVTIRCGVIQGRTVQLYAGAGIMGESQPELEWFETQAKLGTMRHVFGLNEEQL